MKTEKNTAAVRIAEKLARVVRANENGAHSAHSPVGGERGSTAAIAPDALASAKEAGLRYVTDASPGIHRKKRGTGFVYTGPDGKVVRDWEQLARIKALVIPPAWTEVWISADPRGHIQAVGRDARGRKQYRYHERWRAVRDENKYGRMMAFVKALPHIRRRVARDLRKPGMPREKVLAAVVRLLETTFIRVGNEEYAQKNQSYGLTTLHNDHADVRGSKVHFEFRGKSGVEHAVDLNDERIARIVRKCQDLPGEELFGYVDDDGVTHDIGSTDVNDYLREITGEEFTAKDFRTWAGTVLAAAALKELEAVDSQAKRKKNIVSAIDAVAKKLGNTRAVCRKCYIHPMVLESYLDGSFAEQMSERAGQLAKSLSTFKPQEAAVLVLLQRRLKLEVKQRKGKRRVAGKASTAST